MKVLRISHVGLVPRDPEAARACLGGVLGLVGAGSEDVPTEGVRTHFFRGEDGGHLEVLEPLGEGSPIARFAGRGGGIHHIALEVDDIAAWTCYLKEQGVQLTSEEAKPGAHGAQVVFLHPRSTGGILIELTQPGGGRT